MMSLSVMPSGKFLILVLEANNLYKLKKAIRALIKSRKLDQSLNQIDGAVGSIG